MAKKKKADKGVILVALGHKAYFQMAYNIALTIRATSPGIQIALVHEKDKNIIDPDLYDYTIPIKDADMHFGPKVSPARIKSRIADYTPFNHTLYLDVDGFVINDLNVLMEALIATGKPYITSVIDYGTVSKGDYEYNIWASNEDIWAHFELHEDATIPSLNSSFSYFDSSAEAKALMAKVKQFDINRLPYEKLKWTWGKVGSPRDIYPDELTYMAACAACDVDPKFHINPVLFSQKVISAWDTIKAEYFVVAIYGGSQTTHNSVWKYYDRYMHKIGREMNRITYHSEHLRPNKHANGK